MLGSNHLPSPSLYCPYGVMSLHVRTRVNALWPLVEDKGKKGKNGRGLISNFFNLKSIQEILWLNFVNFPKFIREHFLYMYGKRLVAWRAISMATKFSKSFFYYTFAVFLRLDICSWFILDVTKITFQILYSFENNWSCCNLFK